MKNRVLPTLIVGLVGAVIGSFLMMLYASSHFGGATGPDRTPPAIAAVPLSGVSDQDRIVSAVKRTKSSVVAITEEVNGQEVIPADPFFQQFFGGQGPEHRAAISRRSVGLGLRHRLAGRYRHECPRHSASHGGHVTKLTVVFANGDHVPAHVVAANMARMSGSPSRQLREAPAALELADSSRLEQGQWAIAIGEPLELQQTVTVGVVSAFNRSEPIPTENGGEIDFKGLLQTSAPINPGNSGGPLIDIDGQVIGINQSTVKSAYAQGIGFAIPSNTVRTVVAAS